MVDLLKSGGEFTYKNFREDEVFSWLDRFLMGEKILNKF